MNSSEVKVSKGYRRKVQKDEIPTCNILGVNIAAINMEWLLRYLYVHIKSETNNSLAGEYICVSNVHTTVTAYENQKYREIQNGSLMAIPDGGPLSTIGRKRGHNTMSRTTGPSLMEEVFKVSANNGYKHYFYGSTEETLNKMRVNLEKRYPGIQIVGMYSPPFRVLTDEEDALVVQNINDTKPDFIWVGLGAPKQEIWMFNHQGNLNGLMLGVGAGFDYFAENIKRAPKWMQRINMEWFYRLIQDPRRLMKRYFYTNNKFIWYTLVKGK